MEQVRCSSLITKLRSLVLRGQKIPLGLVLSVSIKAIMSEDSIPWQYLLTCCEKYIPLEKGYNSRIALKADSTFDDKEFYNTIESLSLDELKYFVKKSCSTYKNNVSGDHFFNVLIQLETKSIDKIIEEEIDKQVIFYGKDIFVNESLGDTLPNPSLFLIDSFNQFFKSGQAKEVYKKLGLRFTYNNQKPNIYNDLFGQIYINLTVLIDCFDLNLPFEFQAKSKSYQNLSLKWNFKKLCIFMIFLPKNLYLLFYRIPYNVIKTRKILFNKYCSQKEIKNPYIDMPPIEGSNWELLKSLKKTIQINHESFGIDHLVSDHLWVIQQAIMKCLLYPFLGKKTNKVVMNLIAGQTDNFNYKTHKALYDLKHGKKTLDNFLYEFGHRGHPDWDPMAERWRERPDQIMQYFSRCYIAQTHIDPHLNMTKQARHSQKLEQFIHQKIKKTFIGRKLWPLIFKELKYFKQSNQLRETSQSFCYYGVERVRGHLKVLDDRLDLDNLIFSMKLNEIESFIYSNVKVQTILKAKYKKAQFHRQILRSFNLPSKFNFVHLKEDIKTKTVYKDISEFNGLALSNGNHCGEVVVCKNLNDIKSLPILSDNQILVAEHFDPSLSSYFLGAKALILERGGPLSHGAILARECGIVAISGVKQATEKLVDGMTVTVQVDSNQAKIILNS